MGVFPRRSATGENAVPALSVISRCLSVRLTKAVRVYMKFALSMDRRSFKNYPSAHRQVGGLGHSWDGQGTEGAASEDLRVKMGMALQDTAAANEAIMTHSNASTSRWYCGSRRRNGWRFLRIFGIFRPREIEIKACEFNYTAQLNQQY
jgi:hypothetical protein